MSREKQTFGAESITELPCWQGTKQCLCEIECKDCIESHLLAAGWRKQAWIRVEERLPGEFISVLGFMKDAGDFPPVRECYLVGSVFFFPALKDIHPISHWMPLPDPPKGE